MRSASTFSRKFRSQPRHPCRMLTGADCVLRGVCIPRAIPGILDQLTKGFDIEMKNDVKGDGAVDLVGRDPHGI